MPILSRFVLIIAVFASDATAVAQIIALLWALAILGWLQQQQ